jgi:hypothetical protein
MPSNTLIRLALNSDLQLAGLSTPAASRGFHRGCFAFSNIDAFLRAGDRCGAGQGDMGELGRTTRSGGRIAVSAHSELPPVSAGGSFA